MHTRLCELLEIKYPIVGFTPAPEVAAAISLAGGLGVLGAIRYTRPEQLAEAMDWMDERLAGRPYGVDIVMPAKTIDSADMGQLEGMIDDRHRYFVEEVLARFDVPPLPDDDPKPSSIVGWMHEHARAQVEIALEHPIALLANALGSPPREIIDEAHYHGVRVAALAGKVAHALSHKEAGVDIVVAVGHEAGGHTGDITTLVLVPEIVDAMEGLPVLAAGGIGTGRQIAAALALGADGVWMGSAWLTTEEYRVEPPAASGYSVVTEKLLAATSSDTVRSRCISGKPARMLRTPWTEAWEAEDSPGTLPMPLQGMLVAEAEARIRRHQNRVLLGTPVGQIVGKMNAVHPVRDVVAGLVTEFEEAVARMQRAL